MAAIARLVAEREVEAVVLGLPVSLSGDEGGQAAEVRRFAQQLGAVLSVPVETLRRALHDEARTGRRGQGGGGLARGRPPAETYLRARE